MSMMARAQPDASARPRARDIGLAPGVLPTGPLNAITDVAGVRVGQVTIWEGDGVRTGVTAILPHEGNLFQEKVPGAMHLGNAFGKLIGYTQVQELGFIESPIVLTSTLSVWEAADAIVTYLMGLPENGEVRSINPVVGETNDGFLNDIRGRHVKESHVLEAIRIAKSGPVQEGVVGAGTGTVAFGWKGGIGTSSRKLPEKLGGYTVGVLVQSNYGGVLQMDGLPVGQELDRYYLKDEVSENPDGSIMMVVATDAPVAAHSLSRIAKRAMLGLSRTGATSSNGSGDYVIAFSTAPALRSAFETTASTEGAAVLRNDDLSPLFQAAIEATEEAIYNSMLKAVTVEGRDGNRIEALPIDRLLAIGKKFNRLHPPAAGR
jgi:D-aminopeptidase